MINAEERTLTPLPSVTAVSSTFYIFHIGGAQIYSSLSFESRCLLKNEPVSLVNFIFIGPIYKEKHFQRNLTVSQHFRPVFKMSFEKNVGYSKVAALVLIYHFRAIFYCHF